MSEEIARFDAGTMILLCVLAVLIPIVGVIAGAINLKHPRRNDQAKLLLGLGVASFVLGLIILL